MSCIPSYAGADSWSPWSTEKITCRVCGRLAHAFEEVGKRRWSKGWCRHCSNQCRQHSGIPWTEAGKKRQPTQKQAAEFVANRLAILGARLRAGRSTTHCGAILQEYDDQCLAYSEREHGGVGLCLHHWRLLTTGKSRRGLSMRPFSMLPRGDYTPKRIIVDASSPELLLIQLRNTVPGDWKITVNLDGP